MVDVFISYSKQERALTVDLARELEAHGLTVWWDASLLSGDAFEEVIKDELDRARAVVVIWTRSSVGSLWVKAEARRAAAAKKLIPVKASDVAISDIPLPFDGYHTDLVYDREKIFAALRKLGVQGGGSAPAFSVRPGTGESFKDFGAGPEMVVVPAGEFMMGSPANEPGREDNEGPQHKVIIRHPFAVGRAAVTFDEWDAAVAEGGCGGYRPDDQDWGRGDLPVINVEWQHTQTYVKWLREKTGEEYRLLNEAEWEYAARAGTTTPFWWGSSITPDQANYNGSVDPYTGGGRKGEHRQKTIAVKMFQPNPWGLYQVHGNVWEWTEDCWNDSYNGAPADGETRATGNCLRHALRGGSLDEGPALLRSASRFKSFSRINSNAGFRVARTITP